MVNAKLDPFDRAELSPIEMVRAFHIIRANIIVKELSASHGMMISRPRPIGCFSTLMICRWQ
jgi:hypothetical protein